MPTLSAADIICVIEADGWAEISDEGRHPGWKHPTQPGKVSVSKSWTDVRTRDWVFGSILTQAGLTRRQFEALYWEHCR